MTYWQIIVCSVYQELGTPNEKIWPGVSELPYMKKCTFTEYPYNQLRNKFGTTLSETGFDLLNKYVSSLIIMNQLSDMSFDALQIPSRHATATDVNNFHIVSQIPDIQSIPPCGCRECQATSILHGDPSPCQSKHVSHMASQKWDVQDTFPWQLPQAPLWRQSLC